MENQQNFKVYNASAGAGKTFTLAVDYLSLLYSTSDYFAFQKILAITFTNKAVGEMKSRILGYLMDFASGKTGGENSGFYAILKDKVKATDEEIQKKSRFILRNILNNYAGFEISTIDAFTHRIIRTFAKDLGLSSNFEIELNTQELLSEAVDRLINQAGENNELTQVLIDFVIEKTSEDKSGDISLDIFEISTILLNENHLNYVQLLRSFKISDFSTTKKQLFANIKKAQAVKQQSGDAFFALLSKHHLKSTHFTRSTIPKYFEKMKAGEVVKKYDAKWQTNIEETDFYKKSEDEGIKSVIDGIKTEIIDLFYACKTADTSIQLKQHIVKNITQLALLNLVENFLQEIKKDRNLLLISDFNQKISEQIKNQPTPFIYERLGDRFQHYFIDEFQDTSQMQWQNIQPLAFDALAGMYENNLPGSLTLVGDAKQSIYAWRGGDAQQFIDLSSGKNSQHPVQVHQLEYNFRSEFEIIQFNNHLFEYTSTYYPYPIVQELFAKAHQNQIEGTAKTNGYVEVSFLEASNAEEKDEVHPAEVVQIIQKRVGQGKINYADCCVLVRGKKHGISIAEKLSAAGIPIISSETLLIHNHPEVQFLFHLMQLIEQPNHLEYKFKVVEFLHEKQEVNASVDELKEKIHKQSLSVILKSMNIDFSIEKFESLPVYDAVEMALQSFSLYENATAHVLFFLDEIFQFSTKNESDLGSFIRYWEKQKETKSISAPAGENAVQIMTIHKSKGLQFPVVILPYLDQKVGDLSKDRFWIPLEDYPIPYALINGSDGLEQLLPKHLQPHFEHWKSQKTLEDLNVFYVALTRASKEMYLLSSCKTGKNGFTFESKTYASLIKDYLAEKGYYEEGKLTYSFGQPTHFKSSLTTNNEATQSTHFGFTPKSIRQSLNFAGQGVNLWEDHRREALEEGNIIHWVLAKIDYTHEINHSLNAALNEGIIARNKLTYYTKQIKKVVEHPKLKAYFESDWTIKNEQDIAFEGKLYRPDRLCIKDQQAVIIDYKTGSPNALHHEQIKVYKQVVEALGYQVENLFLVYLQNEKIELVEVN